jgi:Flp pilus assembly secretin CpaC
LVAFGFLIPPAAAKQPGIVLRSSKWTKLRFKDRVLNIRVRNPKVADVVRFSHYSVTVIGIKPGKTQLRIKFTGRTVLIAVRVLPGKKARAGKKGQGAAKTPTVKLRVGQGKNLRFKAALAGAKVQNPKVADIVARTKHGITVVGLAPGKTRIALRFRKRTRYTAVVVFRKKKPQAARKPSRGSVKKTRSIRLRVGMSDTVRFQDRISRVQVRNPSVADIVSYLPKSITVVGMRSGRTEILVRFKRRTVRIAVHVRAKKN